MASYSGPIEFTAFSLARSDRPNITRKESRRQRVPYLLPFYQQAVYRSSSQELYLFKSRTTVTSNLHAKMKLKHSELPWTLLSFELS